MAQKSAAFPQLKKYIEIYKRFLPLSTFPLVPFCIAAAFQCFAWFGGRFLGAYTLFPRVILLWLMAFGEYSIMSPSMNAAVEVLGLKENALIIMYNVATLFVFALISLTVFKNKYTWRHIVAFALLVIAFYLVYGDPL